MLAHQRAAETDQIVGRFPAAEDGCGGLGALGVMAHESDPAVHVATGLGLSDVVEERGQPQRLAGCDLVSDHAVELGLQPGHMAGQVVARMVANVGNGLDNVQGVLPHVQLVMRALHAAAKGDDLGQHDVEHAQRLHQPKRLGRTLATEQAPKLHEDALS
jgi:hypothetical protein